MDLRFIRGAVTGLNKRLNFRILVLILLACVAVLYIISTKKYSSHGSSGDTGFIWKEKEEKVPVQEQMVQVQGSSSSSERNYNLNPANESYNLTVAQENVVQGWIAEGSKNVLNLPGVPYILGGGQSPKHLGNSSCAKFPTFFDIRFTNTYWQTYVGYNWTLHALGAFLDDRVLNTNAPSIRIVGTIDRIGPNITAFCQIWFDKEPAPVIAEVTAYHYIWVSAWGNYKNGEWQPYLLNCNIPPSHAKKIPKSVSIAETACSLSTMNLKVEYDKPAKKEGFAICVKGMDFPDDDMSIRLIEWVELQFLLGASKIIMYDLANTANTSKVLNYYQKIGKVQLIPTTLPGYFINEPHLRHAFLKRKVNQKRQTELLPYNDCFYRNMYKYNYIAVVDIDEVLMPKKHANWSELVTELEALKPFVGKIPAFSSFVFHNVYFFHNPADQDESHYEDIPKDYTMLQHVRRTKYNYTKSGYFIKCLHNTERILTLHNHFPRSCLGGCTSHYVDKEIAQMNHYKPTCFQTEKCIEEFKENSVLDNGIWKFKKELVERANNVVATLNLRDNTQDDDHEHINR